MRTIRLSIIGIVLSAICSCQKDPSIELQQSDYLIFGHFYGECIGETCVEIFRLEQDRLYEDRKDAYPTSDNFYVGNYAELSAQKFALAKDLFDIFPHELLDETNKVIGQPDAGDWGGLYIEYNYNGVRRFWLVDKMKRNVPAKYHNFIDKVSEKISQLR
jgi:hypothetical protein